jgi:hypothetical protein
MIDLDKNATHNAQLLAHLQRGESITQREAIMLWNCYRLGARVFDLRQRGHDIRTTIDKRTGHAVYVLVAPAPALPGQDTPRERVRPKERQQSLF